MKTGLFDELEEDHLEIVADVIGEIEKLEAYVGADEVTTALKAAAQATREMPVLFRLFNLRWEVMPKLREHTEHLRATLTARYRAMSDEELADERARLEALPAREVN